MFVSTRYGKIFESERLRKKKQEAEISIAVLHAAKKRFDFAVHALSAAKEIQRNTKFMYCVLFSLLIIFFWNEEEVVSVIKYYVLCIISVVQ